MTATRRLTGIIFSDLGRAASFMALAWVQEALKQRLGFAPFPATLNLRPQAPEDARLWATVRSESSDLALPAQAGGHCGAQIYRVAIYKPGSPAGARIGGAVLVPEVSEYPQDKIEVIAPMRLKENFAVQDGDLLTLEFVH